MYQKYDGSTRILIPLQWYLNGLDWKKFVVFFFNEYGELAESLQCFGIGEVRGRHGRLDM